MTGLAVAGAIGTSPWIISSMNTQFWENPLVQLAAKQAAPEEDPEGFFRQLGELIEGMDAWLKDHRLSLAQITDWQISATLDHDSRWFQGVRRMTYAGLDAGTIAGILGVSRERIEGQLRRDNVSSHGPAVIELHEQGMTVLEISDTLQVPRSTCTKILRASGLTPNVKPKNKRMTNEKRLEVWAMMQRGHRESFIRERCGVTHSQIINVRRWATRQGYRCDVPVEPDHAEHEADATESAGRCGRVPAEGAVLPGPGHQAAAV